MTRKLSLVICMLTLLLNASIGSAASLSPSVIDLTSSGAEVLDSSFTVYNTKTSEQTYFIDTLAFEPSEDGTPIFSPGGTSQNKFLTWVDFPTREVLVPALSKVEVPFRVAIPDDVAGGSYYGAITVSTAPTDIVDANGATVEAKTAILVFLTVEGETVEKLQILDFLLERDDSSHPFGLFSYRLQNQGNVHLSPTGDIRIRGMFGQTIRTLDANPAEGRVLPNSTRTFTVPYLPVAGNWIARASDQLAHLAFGPMTAKLSLTYGTDSTIEASWTLWAIPYELLNLLLLIVAVIFGAYALISLRRKQK